MTEQQERMIGEVLSTVRSLQKCDNRELVGILSRIADGILNDKPTNRYQVSLASVLDFEGRSQKIQVIKVLREFTGIGLKDAKDIVDMVGGVAPVKLLDKMNEEQASRMASQLRALGLSPEVERM